MHLQPWIKLVLSSFVVAIVIGYSSFRLLDFVEGPTISIKTPVNGSTIENELVSIKGHAENISYISLNGAKIYTTPSGVFKEKLLLQPGYNALQVKVTDRYGRVEAKTLELVYHPRDNTHTGVTLTQKQTESTSL